MKNTYILVTEGDNEQWFFSIKDVARFMERDDKYISQMISGRIKRGYLVHNGKIYFMKKLPCGPLQYELLQKMENEVSEVKKTYTSSEEEPCKCTCSCHMKKKNNKLKNKIDEFKQIYIDKMQTELKKTYIDKMNSAITRNA